MGEARSGERGRSRARLQVALGAVQHQLQVASACITFVLIHEQLRCSGVRAPTVGPPSLGGFTYLFHQTPHRRPVKTLQPGDGCPLAESHTVLPHQ